ASHTSGNTDLLSDPAQGALQLLHQLGQCGNLAPHGLALTRARDVQPTNNLISPDERNGDIPRRGASLRVVCLSIFRTGVDPTSVEAFVQARGIDVQVYRFESHRFRALGEALPQVRPVAASLQANRRVPRSRGRAQTHERIG